MRLLLPLILGVAVSAQEELPSLPRLDVMVPLGNPPADPPLARVGRLVDESWFVTPLPGPDGLRWGASPVSADASAAWQLTLSEYTPGARIATPAPVFLAPSADAEVVAVLALRTDGDESVGVHRIVRDAASICIEIERDVTQPDRLHPSVRVLAVPIGRLAAGAQSLIVDERAYSRGADHRRALSAHARWMTAFAVAPTTVTTAATADVHLITHLGRGEPVREDEPRWQPPRSLTRSLTGLSDDDSPQPLPVIWRVGSYDSTTWAPTSPRPAAPPAGTTPMVLVQSPVLNSGERMLLDRVETVGKRWIVTVSLWRDDGGRNQNVPHKDILAIPLDAPVAPDRADIDVRCRTLRAPALGTWYSVEHEAEPAAP